MKKTLALLIPVFLILGFYLFETQNKHSASTEGDNKLSPQASLQEEPAETSDQQDTMQADSDLEWNEHIEKLTGQIGSLTPSPEAIDEEVSSFANRLKATQLSLLYKTVISKYKSGDEKLLAAELLARSPLPDSIEHLKNIITTAPESISGSAALQEEFRAIQLLAIEGITQKPLLRNESVKALQSLLPAVDNSFMHDRIARGLSALQGKAPALEDQDREALQKLLKIHR
ncbi:MAG: hypothetical protein RJB66_914 [Pseudomonadota bacterium]|jgi:hypothetical protein